MKKRIIGVAIAILLMVIVGILAVLVAGGYHETPSEQVNPIEAPAPVVTEIPIEETIVEPIEEPTVEFVEEPAPEPTEEPTTEPTPEPTPVPTLAPVNNEGDGYFVRPPVVVVIEATAVPTAVPTATPTIVPTVVPTAEPTVAPTEVPMPEPTVAPTEATTPEPTPVPTEEPTPVPTEEPTPEPTPVPTEEPTPEPTPVPPQNDYGRINGELLCLTCGGGVYPSYEDAPSYDLYSYISVEDMGAPELFEALTQPFLNGIATWTDMQFSGHGTDGLSAGLRSAVDENTGRIRIANHPENSQAISAIFAEIRQSGDYATANSIMLDWLYKYTAKNPGNPNERWILACN